MARTFSIFACFAYALLHVHQIFIQTCVAEDVPASTLLFVFGDSIFDSGFKNSHASGMRTGHSPYGMECMWYDKFRFTNGLTVPEMIAAELQLKGPVTFDDMKLWPKYDGVNFASASAGILPETGRTLGKNYGMESQVGFFKEALERLLRPTYFSQAPKFSSTEKLSESLSKSIFLVNLGTSDYIFNYLQPKDYNTSRQYNGEDFAELLVGKLGNYLTDLYNLGARKMVIFEIGPLGCLPYIINRVKPGSICVEEANKLASIFNSKLEVKLKELGDRLKGSIFVTARIFHLMKDIIEKPADYGLAETKWPCCAIQENGTGLCNQPKQITLSPEERERHRLDNQMEFQREYSCIRSPPPPPHLKSLQSSSSTGKPTGDLCEDRGSFLFWDELHLTEAANRIISNKCYHATSGSICSPYDIYQLANKI